MANDIRLRYMENGDLIDMRLKKFRGLFQKGTERVFFIKDFATGKSFVYSGNKEGAEKAAIVLYRNNYTKEIPRIFNITDSVM